MLVIFCNAMCEQVLSCYVLWRSAFAVGLHPAIVVIYYSSYTLFESSPERAESAERRELKVQIIMDPGPPQTS